MKASRAWQIAAVALVVFACGCSSSRESAVLGVWRDRTALARELELRPDHTGRHSCKDYILGRETRSEWNLKWDIKDGELILDATMAPTTLFDDTEIASRMGKQWVSRSHVSFSDDGRTMFFENTAYIKQ